MIYFSTRQDLILKDSYGHSQNFKAPAQEMLYPTCIYCTTLGDFNTLNKLSPNNFLPLNEAAIRSVKGFPIELGISNFGQLDSFINASAEINKMDDGLSLPSKLKQFKIIRNKHYNNSAVSLLHQLRLIITTSSVRIAIVNPGAGFGDLMAGITAIKLLHMFLMAHFPSVLLDVYLSKLNNKDLNSIDFLLKDYKHINLISTLPMTLDGLMAYDAFIDNAGIFNREYFFKLPLVDSFLYKYGLDINQYDSAEKRNKFSSELDIPEIKSFFEDLKSQSNKKVILLHFRSSSDLRTVPESQIHKALNILAEFSQYTFITALDSGSKAPNLINASLLSKNVKSFTQIIASVDGIITVDTSTYHIADAFSIPTVILATTFASELYSRYYPFTETYILPGAKQSLFYYEHNSKDANKIINNTELLIMIEKLWRHLDISNAIKRLEQLMKHKKEMGRS